MYQYLHSRGFGGAPTLADWGCTACTHASHDSVEGRTIIKGEMRATKNYIPKVYASERE
jgi:hypothetical protein